ncbi:MAG TPA: CbiX/SirB N-terminal domain-containing protein [Bryobacteraceae bacterium]|nr:CbiX/SirB N-terminal domain-containing protein [Bryobacteraceae bacterium]
MTGMTGYIVFAHGSPIEAANEAVRAVTAEFARSGGYLLVEPAFLEQAQPDLPAAAARLAASGAKRIVVIPYFLTLGLHLQRDLPRIVQSIAGLYPELQIEVTPPLDGHRGLLEVLLDRAGAAAADEG